MICFITHSIQRRMSEHKKATYDTHVGKYNIKKRVYFEEHKGIRIAIKRGKTNKKGRESGNG